MTCAYCLFYPGSPHFFIMGLMEFWQLWNLSVHIVYLRTGENHRANYVTCQVHCEWTKTKSPFVISLTIASTLTGGPDSASGPKELTTVQRQSQAVPEEFLIFSFPSKFTLADGFGFPWGRLGVGSHCVIVAVFQGHHCSSLGLCLLWRYACVIGSSLRIEVQLHDCLITDFKSNQKREPILDVHFLKIIFPEIISGS